MYKILSVIPVVFLSSCFFSNNIIVDESAKKDTTDAKIEDNNQEIVKITKIDTPKEKIKVISQRKIITRNDKDFIIEDIDSNINQENFDLNYQFSGLSKLSSPEAIKLVEELKSTNEGLKFVVYFDFNSSELSELNKNTISAHNEFLKQNPNLKLILHGHTDIAGSRGYNLSLGELRALSVKKIMQGIISIVSFGEEKTISNEDSKNRRVEFIYQ
jgi:outer membrane protein OmpA-like peptidoglycan-associated protein